MENKWRYVQIDKHWPQSYVDFGLWWQLEPMKVVGSKTVGCICNLPIKKMLETMKCYRFISFECRLVHSVTKSKLLYMRVIFFFGVGSCWEKDLCKKEFSFFYFLEGETKGRYVLIDNHFPQSWSWDQYLWMGELYLPINQVNYIIWF